MKSPNDVIIIGGGIIGCSIAYRLAQAGCAVTVVDKGQPGQEASWAAAGMLTPNADAFHAIPETLSELSFASHDLYPDFITELEEETRLKIGYQTTGSVCVACDFNEAQILAGLVERQIRANRKADEIARADFHRFLPGIAERVEVAVFLPDDSYVNNRELMNALVAACQKRGVAFRTQSPVTGLISQDSQVLGVNLPSEQLFADVIVNTAGCWSGSIPLPASLKLPVKPVRGQMICLEKQPQLLQHLVHSSFCYFVPWPDGRILLGSTLENAGFNKVVTAQGVHSLLHAALEILPVLKEARIRETWAGLRPGTPDDLPILGTTSLDNFIVATGHYRNGILLAPITAKLITELILSGKPSASLAAFRLDRFL